MKSQKGDICYGRQNSKEASKKEEKRKEEESFKLIRTERSKEKINTYNPGGIKMGKNIEVEYVVDKETKGTYRFKPKDETLIGNATIYLPKPVLKENDIDPKKGFDLIIRPN